VITTGDVFVWKDYPNQFDGVIKNRWFICLGKVGENRIETDERFLFLLAATATTQLHYYYETGERANHPVVRFGAIDGFGFSSDCLVDFAMPPEMRQKSFWLEKERAGAVEIKGRLTCDKLRQIFSVLCGEMRRAAYSRMEILSIRENLRLIGISDLPIPQKSGRSR
jgi:hypothetical protein